MPYKLRKAPKRDLYWVVNKETGKKHSNEPLPLERAKAQMRALYAAESGQQMKGGGGIAKETLYLLARSAYKGRTYKQLDGWTLVYATPTLKFYQKEKTILVSVRGTDIGDKADLLADIDAYKGVLAQSNRFQKDLATLQLVQQRFPKSQYHYLGVGHSLGGAILDEFLKLRLINYAYSYNAMIQPQDQTNASLPHYRIYHKEDPLYQLFGKNSPKIEVRSGEADFPVWKSYMRSLPYGFGELFKALDAHKIQKFKGGQISNAFQLQLKKIGLSPKAYLATARTAAKEYGYNPKDVDFSEDGEHKLTIKRPDGGLERFGRVHYNDYIIYSHLEACGSVERGTAEQNRERFWKSHSKIRGDWKKDDYSPNWLSMRILW